MKRTIFILLFCFGNIWGFAQKNTAVFLHHSTGGGVFSEGNVSNWVKNYNSANGTNFQIIPRTYPDTPYPWANYPYDYWKLWVNNACDNSNPNIECLASIASKCGLVIYKHCYPGASINPDIGNPDVTSSRQSLENYKLQYRALRILMDGLPDKKFMVWTLVPLHRLATNADEAKRAFEFVNWVKNEWLTEDGQNHPNIFIFDFYSLAAELDQNPVNGKQYCLKYDYEGSHITNDSHPNILANQTIGPIFAQAVVDVLAKNYSVTNITVSSLFGANAISTFHGTLQMQAAILPTDALLKSVTWSVVNLTGKASVDSSGLLSAETNGTVKVVAMATDGSGIVGELQITLTNQEILVQNIAVISSSGTQITTGKGTLQLNAAVLPEDATLKSVTWSLINVTGQATINSSGVVTAEKDGTIKVIATANDRSGIKGELQITISNQIIPIESISIIDNLKNDTILGIGTMLELKASLIPIDVTNPTVDWIVENISGTANIDNKGLLVTTSPGKIKVIAKALDGSTCIDQKEYLISIPVFIEEDINMQNINIFPNPTKDNLQIQIDKIPVDGLLVEIRDVKGQILIKKIVFERKTDWSLGNYQGSVYFVILTDNKNVWTKKIVKSTNSK